MRHHAASKRKYIMKKDHEIKIGLIQQANSSAVDENRKRLAEKISDASRLGAELIVMQELHNTRYFCQVEDLS